MMQHTAYGHYSFGHYQWRIDEPVIIPPVIAERVRKFVYFAADDRNLLFGYNDRKIHFSNRSNNRL